VVLKIAPEKLAALAQGKPMMGGSSGLKRKAEREAPDGAAPRDLKRASFGPGVNGGGAGGKSLVVKLKIGREACRRMAGR
jgi:hypothetical protein